MTRRSMELDIFEELVEQLLRRPTPLSDGHVPKGADAASDGSAAKPGSLR
ncbi:MAG: hypothetical protein AAGB18_03885 [Pseudomonadota bacterium]